jgi:outer membrane protein TolC
MDVSQYNEDSFLQKSKNKEAAKKYLKKYDRQLKILKKRSQLGLVDASAVEQAKMMSELKAIHCSGF